MAGRSVRCVASSALFTSFRSNCYDATMSSKATTMHPDDAAYFTGVPDVNGGHVGAARSARVGTFESPFGDRPSPAHAAAHPTVPWSSGGASRAPPLYHLPPSSEARGPAALLDGRQHASGRGPHPGRSIRQRAGRRVLRHSGPVRRGQGTTPRYDVSRRDRGTL